MWVYSLCQKQNKHFLDDCNRKSQTMPDPERMGGNAEMLSDICG